MKIMQNFIFISRLVLLIIIAMLIFNPAFSASEIYSIFPHKVLAQAAGTWVERASPTCETLRAIRGRDKNDIWAAGDKATVIHFDGTKWTKQNIDYLIGDGPDKISSDTKFYAIGLQDNPDAAWKPQDNAVIIVGDLGSIIKFPYHDSWTYLPNTPQDLYAAALMTNVSPFTPGSLYGGYGEAGQPDNAFVAGGKAKVVKDRNGNDYTAAISFLPLHNIWANYVGVDDKWKIDTKEPYGWNQLRKLAWWVDEYSTNPEAKTKLDLYNSIDWTRELTATGYLTDTINAITVGGYTLYENYPLAAGGSQNSAAFYAMVPSGSTYEWRLIRRFNDNPAVVSMDNNKQSWNLGNVAVGGNANSFQLYFVFGRQNTDFTDFPPYEYFPGNNLLDSRNYKQLYNTDDAALHNPKAVVFSYNDNVGNTGIPRLDDGEFYVATANGNIVSVNVTPHRQLLGYDWEVTHKTVYSPPAGTTRSWNGLWSDPKAMGTNIWAVGEGGHILHLGPKDTNIDDSSQSVACPSVSASRKIYIRVYWKEGNSTRAVEYREVIRDLAKP